MQTNWTIEGEAGQGWDEIPQSLEYRKVSAAKLDFRSLEADELNISIVVEDASLDVFVATPTTTPDSSVRVGATVAVVVACATAGATIRYTTDGSNPTGSSPTVANGATLTVANPSVLKVRATAAGMLASDTKVSQYVLQGVVATGGTTTDAGGFRTHTFLTSGSFVVTNSGTVEYLVVAGGGSGGQNTTNRSGGGGGAGGLLAGSTALAAGTYTVTVGAGGMAKVTQDAASDGGASSIGSTVVTTGGGAGASASGTTAVTGRNGGSGGGGTSNGGGGAALGGGSQGNAGGSPSSLNYGTGGGAGAAGTNRSTVIADGGAGLSSSITGTATTYAIGGGGSLTPDVSVVPNTGRGGAGMFKNAGIRLGANGSTGIVVIKYALAQPVNPTNIPSTASNLPTLRQEMALYRDGVRFFHGNVTNVRSMIRGDSHEHQVTVSGAWWFLEKVPFTSIIADGTGVTAERISFVFGTASLGQDLKTSIEAAINRAAALGCPIATIAGGSTVAAMHAFPRITLNQSTCGQALAELIRLVPDAMVYFDYTVKPAAMRVVRRPTCPTTSFDENTAPITSIDLNPVIELQVDQVTLPAVTRNVTGLTIFNNQTSGNAPTGKDITKRQVITVAGPELDTFLPNDLFDAQTIVKSTNYAILAHDSDSACVTAARNAGLLRLPIFIGGGNIVVYSTRNIYPFFGGYYSLSAFNPTDQSIINANGVNLTSHSILTSGEPADWTGIQYEAVTVSGVMMLVHYLDNQSSNASAGYQYYPTPSYIAEAGFTKCLSGFTGTSWGDDSVEYYFKPYSYSAFATPGATGSSTIYKPADYSFINPPDGLADFLRSTQNWLPYAGDITLEQEDVGATRYVGTKVNIINSLSSFSSMGALVASESIEIESGRTTIQLGAPPRNDYRTLVDKIRKTSQDNISYV
jgi:hypothetical protein